VIPAADERYGNNAVFAFVPATIEKKKE